MSAERVTGVMSGRGRVLWLLLSLVVAALGLSSGWAVGAPANQAGPGRRVALIIGNGDYQYVDNLPKLQNPTNDADDIAKALREFGFEVLEHKNLTLEGMSQAIAEFGKRIAGSEAALFYYAGHGIQVKNQNYLMPINARGESEAGVPYQGVNLNQVLDEMDSAKSQANIVILDACRNNPISGRFRSGKTRGLATPDSVPKGTVIVYATDPGNVAQDGTGRNGLFTSGLLAAFRGEDLSLDGVLTTASAEVERVSNKEQTPYVNGPKTLQKNFFFRAGGATRMTMPPSAAPAASNLSLADIKKEQERRKSWADWQKRMKTEFDEVARLNADPELQAQAWDRFLGGFTQDNPYSDEDDTLRSRARTAKEAAQADVQRKQRGKADAVPEPAVNVQAGRVFQDCPDCPEMVEIPGGSFTMGSTEDETWRFDDEAPPHAVSLQRFAIGKTELTQGQWKAVMGSNPSYFKNCGADCPVENVSWSDAQEFLKRLSAKTGQKYRLPTESEWEYACRAGTRDPYCGGTDVDKVAWQSATSGGKVHPVAGKRPNRFGLYDMSGNVLEWVEDAWHSGYVGAPTDGSAWSVGGEQALRVMRGGSWGLMPQKVRAANREWMRVAERSYLLGFRPARTLP